MLDPRDQLLELNTTAELHERGYRLHGPPICVMAMDPSGSGGDRAVVTATEREVWIRGAVYDPDFLVLVRYVLRGAWAFAQGETFPKVAAAVTAAFRNAERSIDDGTVLGVYLAVECNGVGWGYASHFKETLKGNVIPITTTGGENAHALSSGGFSMPRQAASDQLRMLMEQQVWKVARGAPGAEDVRAEVDAFVWKGKKPQAAEGHHDDHVMSCMIGAWVGSKLIPLSVQIQARNTRTI